MRADEGRAPAVFYHVNLRFFPEGTVIPSGSYGRSARGYTCDKRVPSDCAAALLWEVALETARLCAAPSALSRLDCVFLWETLAQARRFRNSFAAESRCIFEVTPTAGDFKSFRGDYDIIENRPEPYVDYMPHRALDYWTERPGQNVELLVGCSVRVVRYVE